MKIKARILQLTHFGVLIEARGRKPWLPRLAVRVVEGALVRGSMALVLVPRRLAEKKGLAGRNKGEKGP